MKITGHKIRATLNELRFILDGEKEDFNAGQWHFPGEPVPDVLELGANIEALEGTIVRLQMAQAHYNIAVRVRVITTTRSEDMTLAGAIKTVGSADRIASMWAGVASGTTYSGSMFGRPPSREVDTQTALPSMEPADARSQALIARVWANALRATIAEGNSEEREIEWLQPEDLVPL